MNHVMSGPDVPLAGTDQSVLEESSGRVWNRPSMVTDGGFGWINWTSGTFILKLVNSCSRDFHLEVK